MNSSPYTLSMQGLTRRRRLNPSGLRSSLSTHSKLSHHLAGII